MAEIFPDLMKTIKLKIQEAKQLPSTNSMKKIMLRHRIIKLLKTRDLKKSVKAAREKTFYIQKNKVKDDYEASQ